MPRTCAYAYTRSSANDIDADVARVLAERSAARLRLCRSSIRGSSVQGRPRPVRPEWQLSQFEIADMLLRPHLCRRPLVVVRKRRCWVAHTVSGVARRNSHPKIGECTASREQLKRLVALLEARDVGGAVALLSSQTHRGARGGANV